MPAAHNSSWGGGLAYRGQTYIGPVALYRAADARRRVSEQTFLTRLARRRGSGVVVDDALIDEVLYCTTKDYRHRYGQRLTPVRLGDDQTDAAELYRRYDSALQYATFRQRVSRLKELGQLDADSIGDAAQLTRAEWSSFYGGGRRKPFIYAGETYPQHLAKTFASVAAFLRTVGAYEMRGHVWDRLLKGWPIDAAIAEPVLPVTERRGCIYRIIQRSTGKAYVGLTILSPTMRWSQHVLDAVAGSPTLLGQAIRADGPPGFEIETIEDGLDWDALGAREKSWIRALGTLAPEGLNASVGGQAGGGKRKPITIDGERFVSREEAAVTLAARTGLPVHVVAARLRDGRTLPALARTHSRHPAAGSDNWRRWKGILKRAASGVCASWQDYDSFARDVLPTAEPGKELSRLNDNEPWGPANFAWLTRADRIASKTGKSITVDGKVYPSLQALAQAYGVVVSTLKYRLTQGLTPDEAVARPPGPTSRKNRPPVVLDGRVFISLQAAATYAAQAYGLSFDVARDRLRRNRPLSD